MRCVAAAIPKLEKKSGPAPLPSNSPHAADPKAQVKTCLGVNRISKPQLGKLVVGCGSPYTVNDRIFVCFASSKDDRDMPGRLAPKTCRSFFVVKQYAEKSLTMASSMPQVSSLLFSHISEPSISPLRTSSGPC